jgi:hypothetical protein
MTLRWRHLALAMAISSALAWGWHHSALAETDFPRIEMEIAVWSAIKASRDPNDFEAYLNEFPTGLFAELAANRIARLAPDRSPMLLDNIVVLSRFTTDADSLFRLDKTFWDTIKASTDPKDYEIYLRKFPDATYGAIARQRLAILRP